MFSRKWVLATNFLEQTKEVSEPSIQPLFCSSPDSLVISCRSQGISDYTAVDKGFMRNQVKSAWEILIRPDAGESAMIEVQRW